MESAVEPAIFFGGVGLCVLFVLVNLLRIKNASLAARLVSIVLVFAFAFAANMLVVVPIGTSKLYNNGGMWPLSLGMIVIASFVGFHVARSRLARTSPVGNKSARERAPKHDKSAAKAVSVASLATPDVFISYKRDERAIVGAIANRLEALKVSVWFDAELRSGTSFDAEIAQQVRAARCVLVCWSPGAVESDWVRSEATIGRQRGVLAAALLKPCDLPPPFNLVHANDLQAGATHANPEWIATLVRIGELVGRPGLSGYEALGPAPDRRALADWLAANPQDPLFDSAAQRLKSTV